MNRGPFSPQRGSANFQIQRMVEALGTFIKAQGFDPMTAEQGARLALVLKNYLLLKAGLLKMAFGDEILASIGVDPGEYAPAWSCTFLGSNQKRMHVQFHCTADLVPPQPEVFLDNVLSKEASNYLQERWHTIAQDIVPLPPA